MESGTYSYTLIGMSGAGKSTIGKMLAKKTDRFFYDSDSEVVRAAGGMKIPVIFEKYGEKEFRRLEKEILLDLIAKKSNSVISTGGGAMMQTEIAEADFAKTTSIWLKVSESALWERQKHNVAARPMLNAENPRERMQKLLAEREPIFQKADVIIEQDGLSMKEIVELIRTKLNERSPK